MKNRTIFNLYDGQISRGEELSGMGNFLYPGISLLPMVKTQVQEPASELPDILFVSSYPPRECGIATYSQDLIIALNNKFSKSFAIKVCALESGDTGYSYPPEVKYTLKTTRNYDYSKLAFKINRNVGIKTVLIQHEFGFFKQQEEAFLKFLNDLSKPVVIVFHTVLPRPDKELKAQIRRIAAACRSIIVMTHHSAHILSDEYGIQLQKISVIAHGTHLVPHLSEKFLKNKYDLTGRKVLTTFGLLSSGKSIETTLNALPAIVKTNPEVMFLIIGKTHPEVVKSEGEKYREMLELKVEQSGLKDHVKFINGYLALPKLLEYLQLTDIYLFTTNDPNQAVSGTFAYAMSCGCPIISTPIPHATEILTKDTGIIFDFRDSKQLAENVCRLLNDESLRKSMIVNTLQKIISTAWENSAVAHAMLFSEIAGDKIPVSYNFPALDLKHLKLMSTRKGMIQFSKINLPDLSSGYTLDDNARALVVMGMYFRQTGDSESIDEIRKYLGFIRYCQQSDGRFQNYVDKKGNFTTQNQEVNLDDSNGRAIWALGYIISLTGLLPVEIISEAEICLKKVIPSIDEVTSTRAMAFAVKGLYYYQRSIESDENIVLVRTLADRLVQMYRHESSVNWEWFESYLTYANSILPEALLNAWLITGDDTYRDIADSSLKFLISQTFNDNGIEVISNKNWLKKGQKADHFGEQPIDVAYTIMTLGKFYDEFRDAEYKLLMETAFNWFLGKNRLHQIVYNPCTGGCYDGLEKTHVNLNQGAESTLSYLLARLTMEKVKSSKGFSGIERGRVAVNADTMGSRKKRSRKLVE